MMRKMKKFIAMLLCVAMTAAFVPAFAVGAASGTVYTAAAGQTEEGIYALPQVISEGSASIGFDIMFNSASCNTLIAFNAAAGMTSGSYFSNSQVMLLASSGDLQGRNGSVTVSGYSYSVEESYHIKVTIDMDNEMWDATVYSSSGTALYTYDDYAFRTSASQIDSLVLVDNSGQSDAVTITNLVMTLSGEEATDEGGEEPTEEESDAVIEYFYGEDIICTKTVKESQIERFAAQYAAVNGNDGNKYYVVSESYTLDTADEIINVSVEVERLGNVFTINTSDGLYYTSDDGVEGEPDFKAYVWSRDNDAGVRVPFAVLDVPENIESYGLSAVVTRRYDAGNYNSQVEFFAMSTAQLAELDITDIDAIDALATDDNRVAATVSRINPGSSRDNTTSVSIFFELDDEVVKNAAEEDGQIVIFALANRGLYKINGASMEIVSKYVDVIYTYEEKAVYTATISRDDFDEYTKEYRAVNGSDGYKYYVKDDDITEDDIVIEDSVCKVYASLERLGDVYTIKTTDTTVYHLDNEQEGIWDFNIYRWAVDEQVWGTRVPFAALYVPEDADEYILTGVNTRRMTEGGSTSTFATGDFYAITTAQLAALDVTDFDAIEALCTDENCVADQLIWSTTAGDTQGYNCEDEIFIPLNKSVIDKLKDEDGKVVILAIALGGIYRIRGNSMSIVGAEGIVPVTDIYLDKSEIGLVRGESATLTATIWPINATNRNLAWTSSNESVAKVYDGVVTGVGVGTATITATAASGQIAATCTVTVTSGNVAVTGITLDKESVSMTVGEYEMITASITPGTATNSNVSWESSDESVAIVDNGIVTAVGSGTAVVTATTEDGGYTAECEITVNVPIEEDTATVTVGTAAAYTGENVTIPVSISNNSGIAGFRFKITYDKDVLTPVSVAKGAILTSGTLTSNIQQGGDMSSYEYVIAYYENTTNVTDDGVILNVTFAVNSDAESGETPIEIIYEEGDVVTQDYDYVTLNITNGGVNVEKVVPVSSVTLSKTEAEMTAGDTMTLAATVAPSNATYPAVTWASSDESVATIKNGVITALKTGSTVITATAGGVSASCSVTVKPKYTADIEVGASSGYAGENVTIPIVISNNPGVAGFRLKITYDTDVLAPVSIAKGDVLTSGTLTSNIQQGGDMSSYEYIIAYYENTTNITENGVILYVTFTIDSDAAEGSTPIEISCESGDVVTQDYDYVELNITNGAVEVSRIVNVTGVKLDKSTISMEKGKTATLTAEVSPSDATNAGVTWASSDESVATVSNGVVSALKAGSAVITVTTEDGGYKASCTVTVTVPAESVELSETEITLIPGKTAEITAAVLPSDTTDTIVTWASSNESVATVEDGVITAIAPGSAEITAIAGSASAVCTVTVREIMKGDVRDDSRVNAADGVRLRQYLAQWALNLSDYELAAADVNVDDSINAKDGILLRRYLSGWSTTLSDMSLMGMSLFNENNLTIEVDNVTGKAGDYVDVPIMITNNPGVTAFNLLINFDKTALTPVSITAGEALSTGSIESNVNDTSIDLTLLNYVTVYYENVGNDYGTGVLCTVRFVISGEAEGENEISLTLIEAYDEELEDMAVDMTAGSVTVEGAVGTYYTINSVSNDGKVSVTKEKPYNIGGVLIVAKYADGALIDKEVIEMSDMSDGETKVIQSSLTAGEGESLKAFIWRSVSDMRALSNVVK